MKTTVLVVGALVAATFANVTARAATPYHPAYARSTQFAFPHRYAPLNRQAQVAQARIANARLAANRFGTRYAQPVRTTQMARGAQPARAVAPVYGQRLASSAWHYRGFPQAQRRVAARPYPARVPAATQQTASASTTIGAGLSTLFGGGVAPQTAGVAPQPQTSVAPRATGTYGIQTGSASYYGGGRTASGGVVGGATCAHRSLPFGTRVLVTNLANSRTAVLTVNDRGPFVGGRIIDVSTGAASTLGMLHSGVAPVRVQVVGGPG